MSSLAALLGLVASAPSLAAQGCIELEGKSPAEASALLAAHGLSPALLSVDPSEETGLGTYYRVAKDARGRPLAVLDFDLRDPLTHAQFAFHLAKRAALQTASFFPYRAHCVTRTELGHILFAPRRSLTPLHRLLPRLDASQLPRLAAAAAHLFRAFEQAGAVFAHFALSFALDARGTLALEPRSLAFVCAAGQPCYCPAYLWTARARAGTPDYRLAERRDGSLFAAVEARNSWNRYMLLEAMEFFFQSWARRAPLPLAAAGALRSARRIDRENSRVRREKRVHYGWAEAEGLLWEGQDAVRAAPKPRLPSFAEELHELGITAKRNQISPSAVELGNTAAIDNALQRQRAPDVFSLAAS